MRIRVSVVKAASAFCAAVSVVFFASTASAQWHEQQVGKVGTFTILKISQGGKFHRCAASKGSGASMLRIAFTADREHFMSVPGVDGSGKTPLRIRFDGKPPIQIVPNAADKNRASVPLDYATVDRFMAAKRLEVALAGNTYTWDLSGQSMEAVLQAVANCTSSAAS